MFVTAVTGLAPMVVDELDQTGGVEPVGQGFDGRGDVVLVRARSGLHRRMLGLDTVEDVFVEVTRCQPAAGDDSRSVARRLWRPERVGAALGGWTVLTGHRQRHLSYRVVVRVLGERDFRRGDLRRELDATIRRDRPQWRVGDPADLEVWALEYRPGRLVAGLRVSDAQMRQHGRRDVQRPGALRPTVAAAMLRLAGPSAGTPIDPCCGSGTILSEALRAGWTVRGCDIDLDAVRIARRNVPAAAAAVGDARALDTPDASVGACVSSMPFGRRFTVDTEHGDWLRAAIGEMARVTRPGGRVVVLTPTIASPLVPAALTPVRTVRVCLLGTWTRMYAYART